MTLRWSTAVLVVLTGLLPALACSSASKGATADPCAAGTIPVGGECTIANDCDEGADGCISPSTCQGAEIRGDMVVGFCTTSCGGLDGNTPTDAPCAGASALGPKCLSYMNSPACAGAAPIAYANTWVCCPASGCPAEYSPACTDHSSSGSSSGSGSGSGSGSSAGNCSSTGVCAYGVCQPDGQCITLGPYDKCTAASQCDTQTCNANGCCGQTSNEACLPSGPSADSVCVVDCQCCSNSCGVAVAGVCD